MLCEEKLNIRKGRLQNKEWNRKLIQQLRKKGRKIDRKIKEMENDVKKVNLM